MRLTANGVYIYSTTHIVHRYVVERALRGLMCVSVLARLIVCRVGCLLLLCVRGGNEVGAKGVALPCRRSLNEFPQGRWAEWYY